MERNLSESHSFHRQALNCKEYYFKVGSKDIYAFLNIYINVSSFYEEYSI